VEILEPDEIITDGFGAPGDLDPDALLKEFNRLVREGQLALPSPSKDALPMLALGAAGGFIGASLLRGTLGLVVGGGLAIWAWSQLSK